MQLNSSLFRGASKSTVADALVQFIHQVFRPDGDWTVDAGLNCVDTLLIAARKAYPEGPKVELQSQRQDVLAVGRNLAKQIDVVRREFQEKEND